MADKPDDKSGELILTLQNRINDLGVKIDALEQERKGKNYVEAAALDSKIAELKALDSALETKLTGLIKGKGNGNNGDHTKSWLEEIFSGIFDF